MTRTEKEQHAKAVGFFTCTACGHQGEPVHIRMWLDNVVDPETKVAGPATIQARCPKCKDERQFVAKGV